LSPQRTLAGLHLHLYGRRALDQQLLSFQGLCFMHLFSRSMWRVNSLWLESLPFVTSEVLLQNLNSMATVGTMPKTPANSFKKRQIWTSRVTYHNHRYLGGRGQKNHSLRQLWAKKLMRTHLNQQVTCGSTHLSMQEKLIGISRSEAR
jgi:hypothetical protein